MHISLIRIHNFKRDFNLYVGSGFVRTGIQDSVQTMQNDVPIMNARNYNVLSYKVNVNAVLKIRVTPYTE